MQRRSDVATPLVEEEAQLTLNAAHEGRPRHKEAKVKSPTCGPEALYYLLHSKQSSVSAKSVLDLFKDTQDGVSLLEIKQACSALGETSVVKKFSPKHIRSVTLPAILATSDGHFIVVYGRIDGGYVLIDPPYGVSITTESSLQAWWSGYALWFTG